MNDIAQMEAIVLQSIFSDSFEYINDTTVRIRYQSTLYKCDIVFTVEYAPDYPNEPNALYVTAEYLHPQLLNTLAARLTQNQLQYLNDSQGYIYELVCSVDETELQFEQASQSSEAEDVEKEEVNHGLLPGRPCTEEAFRAWFADYARRKNIDLIEEDTWQHALHPTLTGYEIWEQKKNDQLREE